MKKSYRAPAFSLLLAIVIYVIYSPLLAADFANPDTLPLIETARLRSFSDLFHIWSRPLMAGRMENALYFRPLASMSWGIDLRIWGFHAYGFHLTDIILHLVNAIALFAFVRTLWLPNEPELDARTVRTGWLAAAMTSLLFAVHPAVMGAVPVIDRRPDLLLGVFTLLSLQCAVQHVRGMGKWYRRLSLSFAACAFLSKDVGIIILPLLTLLFCVESPVATVRGKLLQSLRRAIPWFATAGCVFAYRIHVLHGLGGYALKEPPELSLWRSIGRYVADYVILVPAYMSDRFLVMLAAAGVLLFVVAGRYEGTLDRQGGQPQVLEHLSSSSCRRLRVFAGGALAAFLVLHATARTPAFAGHLYVPTMFVALLLSCSVMPFAHLTHARNLAPPPNRGRHGRLFAGLLWTRGVLSVGLSMWAAIYGVAHSRSQIGAWVEAGEITRRTILQIRGALGSVSPGSTVYFVNFPYARSDNARMFLQHTLQSIVDLEFPAKELVVVSVSQLVLPPGHGFGSYDISYSPERHAIDIRMSGGAQTIDYPWGERAYGALHHVYKYEYVEIGSGDERAEVILKRENENKFANATYFLVYLGNRLSLAGEEAWHVYSDSP
jgi:hypothetical protein